MDWESIYLFLFDIHAVRYGSFELHASNPDVSLQEFEFRDNERFFYVYDMGDHWEHETRVEAINHGPCRCLSKLVGSLFHFNFNRERAFMKILPLRSGRVLPLKAT
ncbi:pRiA4b ORF-3-like protein [Sedimentitalea nanhaiensis]|uniref:PRiA4b ORF-3-like protein n=2 Tax=Sedimentitalea nanhaiensis TaxID=999627 RepID=A0A1I7EBJ5_9RHOB|nr:pRiA4b ORF-3-like protein [Sedimentitalea nanhaiensis]